jgi:hypothetical protein
MVRSQVESIEPPADGSHETFLAVTLSVADWRNIAENLMLDADAASAGPRGLPCHQTQASTERCAEAIFDVLNTAGWPK